MPLAMQVQALEDEGVGKKLYYYQNDPNGMPLRLLDENGIIAWEGHYSAFGLVDRVSVEAVGQPLRLQGQYFDQE
ncbi:MAG: RHS domain-containing protein [Peptococcaceae bacterium]|nr:RHS domain-containing protein [Peptococcaceae bacterium]